MSMNGDPLTAKSDTQLWQRSGEGDGTIEVAMVTGPLPMLGGNVDAQVRHRGLSGHGTSRRSCRGGRP